MIDGFFVNKQGLGDFGDSPTACEENDRVETISESLVSQFAVLPLEASDLLICLSEVRHGNGTYATRERITLSESGGRQKLDRGISYERVLKWS